MRILLIEDDKQISMSLSKSLKAEGYAVDLAFDGLNGESLAKTSDYDVIILDIMLPKQDGWTTCKNLRNNNITSPIIMLTALDDVADKINGLDCGADDYLAKPFHFGELMARLRSLSRRKTEVKTAFIDQYGLRLNLNTHQAFREGKEIKLTTKEFALLELFMMKSDKIISRETISEHLWDMNFEPKSNIIESFIKFLRQKIDKGFAQPLIHTIRGAGYIFSNRKIE